MDKLNIRLIINRNTAEFPIVRKANNTRTIKNLLIDSHGKDASGITSTYKTFRFKKGISRTFKGCHIIENMNSGEIGVFNHNRNVGFYFKINWNREVAIIGTRKKNKNNNENKKDMFYHNIISSSINMMRQPVWHIITLHLLYNISLLLQKVNQNVIIFGRYQWQM